MVILYFLVMTHIDSNDPEVTVEVLLHGVRSGMAELHLSTPEPFDYKRPDE